MYYSYLLQAAPASLSSQLMGVGASGVPAGGQMFATTDQLSSLAAAINPTAAGLVAVSSAAINPAQQVMLVKEQGGEYKQSLFPAFYPHPTYCVLP